MLKREIIGLFPRKVKRSPMTTHKYPASTECVPRLPANICFHLLILPISPPSTKSFSLI
uniref:Uncharacterized protein n=1 Tax=Arundo donax TaxID=35708 RepID=A0A0A8YYU7_ARUDO